MNPELFQVAGAVVTFGGAAIFAVAYDRWTAGRGVRRAPRPRGERVPATVAPEMAVPCVGFHDRPLTISPATVAADWGHCTECTARRYGQVLTDGTFVCVEGHHTPAGEAL